MTKASWAFLIDSVPFTKATRDGLTSLGGSESACVGLMRALAARHDVTAYVSKLAQDAVGTDDGGVLWLPLEAFAQYNQFIDYDVVVGLRMPAFFTHPINARLRVLWNQDLLVKDMGQHVMAISWALDKSVYVSEYHRAQWENAQPELKPIGAVTKNGFDASLVPDPLSVVKDPTRLIHISRPERGLAPLLAMWPAIRKAKPTATLRICRYQSMYDGEGSEVRSACLAYDERVKAVNAAVGGIEYLGALNKRDLYKAIATSAVMWYPGIAGFAETSCIAAIESQANGTPFVGSLKGALPETARPSFDAGLLIPGDAETEPYQRASVAAVLRLMDGCASNSREYRELVKAGRKHVATYTYDALAVEWEAMVDGWFAERYEGHKIRVLRQLLHEDDHSAAKLVAQDICSAPCVDDAAESREAAAAYTLCERIFAGKEHSADDYARHALPDPVHEAKVCERFQAVASYFDGCRRVLDVACGNGAGAISLALAHPSLSVVGVDYSAENIRAAIEAAERAGVGERCTFYQATIWDFDTNAPSGEMESRFDTAERFDGMFVGEFVEHVADSATLIDWLERFCADGARVVYTCPRGPFVELLRRGEQRQYTHVHCFAHDDVERVWGGKRDYDARYFAIGHSQRLAPIGHWIIYYRVAPNRPAGTRDLDTRARRTRPMERLSVGLIAKNAENDIGRCLASVWGIADEIVVGDTGSSDGTKAIATHYGAKVVELPDVMQVLEGFAGVRNAVLDACAGDWFLWIDTDEQLQFGHLLRRYMDGAILNGVVLHQQHVYLDSAPSHDIPTRLFRLRPDIQFYGCVHEQPQMGDCNTEITPALEVDDVLIAHMGYLTHDVREQKRSLRNRPLLLRDQRVFPDRQLGNVLLLREAVVQADIERVRAGEMTDYAEAGYLHALDVFERHFADPSHKFFVLARPWYEAALRHLGLGWEFEWAFAGRPGSLGASKASVSRIRVRDEHDLVRWMDAQKARAVKQMAIPEPKTDPFVLPMGVSA